MLDRLLRRLFRHKESLLRVLDRPEIPLNTNASENDIRAFVTKRKISGGTVSLKGRDARDIMLGLAKTCMKLNLSFYDFLGARLAIPGPQIPPLPKLIRPHTLITPSNLPGNLPRLRGRVLTTANHLTHPGVPKASLGSLVIRLYILCLPSVRPTPSSNRLGRETRWLSSVPQQCRRASQGNAAAWPAALVRGFGRPRPASAPLAVHPPR